jgi:replicative DNA helicase
MPKAPNLTEATNLAIREVKRIAVENNVIVVLLSQLSRAVEGRFDKHPLLSDLRNGSLLEEISDMILMIYREEYYSAEPEFPRNEIIVAKNTMGPTGTVCLDFKNGYFRNFSSDNTF